MTAPMQVEARISGGLVKVRCPFCRKTHVHARRAGVLRAHCGDGVYQITVPEPPPVNGLPVDVLESEL